MLEVIEMVTHGMSELYILETVHELFVQEWISPVYSYNYNNYNYIYHFSIIM